MWFNERTSLLSLVPHNDKIRKLHLFSVLILVFLSFHFGFLDFVASNLFLLSFYHFN